MLTKLLYIQYCAEVPLYQFAFHPPNPIDRVASTASNGHSRYLAQGTESLPNQKWRMFTICSALCREFFLQSTRWLLLKGWLSPFLGQSVAAVVWDLL